MSNEEFNRLTEKGLSDDELLLRCVELILKKNSIDRLKDVLDESRELFNFIVSETR